MSLAAPSTRPLTGRHVLAAMVLFFAVIVGLDVLFATLAYRSFSGEVARDPYTAGIAYNEILAQRARQDALGWRVTAAVEEDRMVLAWRDRAGRPIEGLELAAHLVRPATESGRRPLPFRADGEGRYIADLSGHPGAWDLQATATGAEGERFELSYRIGAR